MILVLSSMTGSNEHFGDPNQSATAGIVPTVIDGKHPAFPSFSPDKEEARHEHVQGKSTGPHQADGRPDDRRRAIGRRRPEAGTQSRTASQALASQTLANKGLRRVLSSQVFGRSFRSGLPALSGTRRTGRRHSPGRSKRRPSRDSG